MWFNGDVNDALVIEMDGAGNSFDLNIGLALGFGPGLGAFASTNGPDITWYGGNISLGWGIGGSIGFDYTYTTPFY